MYEKMGWRERESSGSEALALHAWGNEFDLQNPPENTKPGGVPLSWQPGEVEMARSLALTGKFVFHNRELVGQ